jgi:hypothetical protein
MRILNNVMRSFWACDKFIKFYRKGLWPLFVESSEVLTSRNPPFFCRIPLP